MKGRVALSGWVCNLERWLQAKPSKWAFPELLYDHIRNLQVRLSSFSGNNDWLEEAEGLFLNGSESLMNALKAQLYRLVVLVGWVGIGRTLVALVHLVNHKFGDIGIGYVV